MNKLDQEIFINEKFEKLDFIDTISNKKFEDCQFVNCNLEKIALEKCKFSNCTFIECNLSLVTVSQSSFSEVVFDNSKIIGVNWSLAKWPSYNLNSPLSFYYCNISHSSFFELSLPQIIIESCKAHDVDFRSADLSSANLASTDFYQSFFVHTNLISADLTDAINYNIDIFENQIKNATFSFPEVTSLLNTLKIKILGL